MAKSEFEKVKEQRDDLLAVLKLILPILEAVRYTVGLGKHQMDRIAKAKAAISKATGQ